MRIEDIGPLTLAVIYHVVFADKVSREDFAGVLAPFWPWSDPQADTFVSEHWEEIVSRAARLTDRVEEPLRLWRVDYVPVIEAVADRFVAEAGLEGEVWSALHSRPPQRFSGLVAMPSKPRSDIERAFVQRFDGIIDFLVVKFVLMLAVVAQAPSD